MKKKLTENKVHMFSPSITFVTQNESHQNQNKVGFNRSKTPFFRKKNNFNTFNSDDENLTSNFLNKSINNQTFIYNSINFNNQGLFNNINNTNNTNNNNKRRKSGGNNYLVNNGILNFFETVKKSRSISKQKKSKYINIINKLSNAPIFCKTLNKHKTKSSSKQKNNSFKNDKRKINTVINFNHIKTSPSYMSNTNNFNRKNKRKLMTTNYNVNKNYNMLTVLNNNTKINNLIMGNNTKIKKNKKNIDINNNNKNININNLKNLEEGDSDRIDLNIHNTSEEYNVTEAEKNILLQIESLIFQLLNNCSSPKKYILKEIKNIYKNAIEFCNTNDSNSNQNYLGTEGDIPYNKKMNNNRVISKKNSKKNFETDSKIINNKSNNIINIETNSNNNKNIGKNKEVIEKELNILNKKYNQMKEENINLKYLITEKTTAFEDVKNSLKNFQNEINQLKNNNHNDLKIKTSEKENENKKGNDIIINSKGLEMKNIKLNLSNVQRVNEIEELTSAKNRQKEANKENNTNSYNNYSFGQNNSLELHFENSNNSQKDLLNSNRSIDLLSLTFHDNIDELQQNVVGQEINLKNYDFSPSLRKATEILIQTGTMPNKNEKKIK